MSGLSEDVSSSPHLHSRQEVGKVLRDCGVNVIEFRASVVLGSGSLSFEKLQEVPVRSLGRRLTPQMIGKRLARYHAGEDTMVLLQEFGIYHR